MLRPIKEYLELAILISINIGMWVGIVYLIKSIIVW
jgi:hypothetical protein